MSTFSRLFFDLILFVLAGSKDMHKISDEFEFQPEWTTDSLAALERLKNFSWTYNGKMLSPC